MAVEPNAPVVGCPNIDLFAAKENRVKSRGRGRIFRLTGTEPRAKPTCLGLLGSSERSGGLRLRLTKGPGPRTKDTSTCSCGAFELLVGRARLKEDNRTKSAGGGLLTKSSVTCTEESTRLLLLRLRGTESAGAEAGRLLWLCLTKRTKRGPGLLLLLLLRLLLLLLLLAKCTEARSGSGASGSKSACTTTKSGLSGLCCGWSLAEQPSRCRRLCGRTKRTRTESPCRGCLTILLVVLQPEFLRRAKSGVSDESGGGFPRDEDGPKYRDPRERSDLLQRIDRDKLAYKLCSDTLR